MKKKIIIVGAFLLVLAAIPIYLFGTGKYVWIDSVPIRYAITMEEAGEVQSEQLTTTDIDEAKKMVRFKHIYSQKEIDKIDSIRIYINLDEDYLEHKEIDMSELKYFHNLEFLRLQNESLMQKEGIREYVKNGDVANYNRALQETSLITGLDQIYKLNKLEEVELDVVKIHGKANFGEIKKLVIWYSNLNDITWIEKSLSLESIEIIYLEGTDFNRDFKKKLLNLKEYKELQL